MSSRYIDFYHYEFKGKSALELERSVIDFLGLPDSCTGSELRDASYAFLRQQQLVVFDLVKSALLPHELDQEIRRRTKENKGLQSDNYLLWRPWFAFRDPVKAVYCHAIEQ